MFYFFMLEIMFNKVRCADTPLRSITNAGAYMSGKKTQKDKTQEKNLNNDPIDQTDGSDAFDGLVWGVLKMKLVPRHKQSIEGEVILR